jgi:ribosomal protein S12
MAKVILNNGINVDALVMVKANLREYMEHSRNLIEESEKYDLPVNRAELIKLQNIIHFLSLDIENLPVRKYKQNRGVN